MEGIRYNDNGELVIDFEHEGEALDAVIANFERYREANPKDESENGRKLKECIAALKKTASLVSECLSGAPAPRLQAVQLREHVQKFLDNLGLVDVSVEVVTKYDADQYDYAVAIHDDRIPTRTVVSCKDGSYSSWSRVQMSPVGHSIRVYQKGGSLLNAMYAAFQKVMESRFYKAESNS